MVVRQVTEHVQGDAGLIARLKDADVVPNARVMVEAGPNGGVMIVVPGHEQVELPHEMAHALKVVKVGGGPSDTSPGKNHHGPSTDRLTASAVAPRAGRRAEIR